MMIIGLDPGYDRLGWAVGQKNGNHWQNLSFGCIQTSKKDNLFDRYLQMNNELQLILDRCKPQSSAIETLFFSVNKKTALIVSEARGVVLSCLIRNKIEISEYHPVKIKLNLTGYGKADKKAVEKMVRMELGLTEPIIDDAIDALAIMIMHQSQYKFNKMTAK
jgi:crossover junction endodeoxyribonuclease RuvC